MIHVEVNEKAIGDLMGGNGDKVYVVQKDLPCGLRKGDEVSNTCLFSNGYEAVITRNNDGLLRQRVIYSKAIVEQNTDFFLPKTTIPPIIQFLREKDSQKHQYLCCSIQDAISMLGKTNCPNNHCTRTWTFNHEVKGYVTSIEAYNYWFHIIDLSKYKD